MSNALTLARPAAPPALPEPAAATRRASILGELAASGIRVGAAPLLLVADVATEGKTFGVDVPPSIVAGVAGGLVAGVCAAFGASPRYGLAVCEGVATSWLMKGVLRIGQGAAFRETSGKVEVKERAA